MAGVRQVSPKRERKTCHKRTETRNSKMPRQDKHEDGSQQMCQHVKRVVDPFGNHAISIKRHDVDKKFQGIEKAGLHLTNKGASREAKRIPNREDSFVNRRCSEVVPGIALCDRFPLPQHRELLREDKLPVKERYGDKEKQNPPAGSHGRILSQKR